MAGSVSNLMIRASLLEYEKWITLGAAEFRLNFSAKLRTSVGVNHGELQNE
jgi:hypothetical protein